MGRLQSVDRGPAAIGVLPGGNETRDDDGPNRQGEYSGSSPVRGGRLDETTDRRDTIRRP